MKEFKYITGTDIKIRSGISDFEHDYSIHIRTPFIVKSSINISTTTLLIENLTPIICYTLNIDNDRI